MEVVIGLGSWILGAFSPSLTANYQNIISSIYTERNITAELGPKLSAGAQIYTTETPEFNGAVARWSLYNPPSFKVVVQVAEEEDVAQTVKYASENDIQFLAVAGGHGAISSLSGIQNGIEIWLNKLDSVSISEEGDTATFGGGVLSKKVTDTLWAAGKQTVTGGCECTSLLGPGLGGGHGFLQGRYGLISDQFVSMRVVTADGVIRTVSSSSSHSDLWWAMQGAGHNFGIVTSVTSKIYDARGNIWSYESYIFTHDNVEELYDRTNQLAIIQPAEVTFGSYFLSIPDIDPEKPVIMSFVLQGDASAVDSTYTTPFLDLGPTVVNSGSGPYPDIPVWLMLTNNDMVCQKGTRAIRFPVNLQSYNITAQRAVFDAFAQGISDKPQFNSSLVLLEGYSVQGVKAVPNDSTAFPHRNDELLVSPAIFYTDPALDSEAVAFGQHLRQILFEGSGEKELHAYVNYAAGNEQPKNWYGYESWRLDRLKSLKNKYDPKGVFNFYAPIG